MGQQQPELLHQHWLISQGLKAMAFQPARRNQLRADRQGQLPVAGALDPRLGLLQAAGCCFTS